MSLSYLRIELYTDCPLIRSILRNMIRKIHSCHLTGLFFSKSLVNFRIESLSLPAFLFIKTSPHKPWDSNILMTSSDESEKKSNTNEF